MKDNKQSRSIILQYYRLIEDLITKLGNDPQKSRMSQPGQWEVKKQKLPVWLYITYNKFYKEYFLQVAAPIIRMPKENQAAFAEQLINLNSKLVGAAFMEKNGVVYMNTDREMIGLEFEEAYRLVCRVINYAKYYHQARRNGLLNWPPYRTQDPNKPHRHSL